MTKKNIQFIEGQNFSGRTSYLRKVIKNHLIHYDKPVAYIGPEVFTSFSGLTDKVVSELELLDTGNLNSIVTSLRLGNLLNRNLSTLSGGEEALCAIATALVLSPQLLALDCVMEQLDSTRISLTLETLKNCSVESILIADNRFNEWDNNNLDVYNVIMEQDLTNKYDTINSQAILPPHPDHINDIIISDLFYKYNKNKSWILNNISLHLQAGHIIHLDGATAAGKSTLSKLLVGILMPSKGNIAYKDHDSFWKEPGRIVAYHFQNPDMQLFRANVLSEITAGAKQHHRDKKTVSNLIDSAITTFGIENILNVHPQELPFSMRKRVAMAATLACGTPWIILDEPTLGQDNRTVEQLAQYFIRLAKSGMGVIIISHSKSFIEYLQAERILLFGGKIYKEFNDEKT